MTRVGAKCTAQGRRYIASPVEHETDNCIGCVGRTPPNERYKLNGKTDRLCHELDDCTGDKKHKPVIWKPLEGN